MTTSTSLIEFLMSLLRDPEALSAYQDDPNGYLASCGLSNISPADVHDGLVLLEDNQSADFSRHTNVGNDVHVATPPPAPHPAPGVTEHDAAIQYLNSYITNNYVTDNSFNQQVDTGGGDFDQDLDIHNATANGAGSVAVGGDVSDSPITTGDHNTVGDNNVHGDGNIIGDDNDGNLTGGGDGNVVGDDNQAVTGDHNTTSFGEGSATSIGGDVSVGDGGAFGVGGSSVDVDNSDHSLHDSGNVDNSVHDSGNTDNSIHDSGNTETHVDVEDSGNDNSDHSIHDSGNDNSHTDVDHSVIVDG
jgi:hypothetical protein